MSLEWEGAIADTGTPVLTASAGLGEQGMTIGLALMSAFFARSVFTKPFHSVDL